MRRGAWGGGDALGDGLEHDVDEVGVLPRMSASKAAECCRRTAKARNERKMASWTSRLGSLCSRTWFERLTGAAEAQQRIGCP